MQFFTQKPKKIAQSEIILELLTNLLVIFIYANVGTRFRTHKSFGVFPRCFGDASPSVFLEQTRKYAFRIIH